jgi:hypothetical protein
MGTLPIGKGAGKKSNAARRTSPQLQANLEALTQKAQYITDAEGRRQAVVLEYAAWQNFLRQVGATASGAAAGNAEYALRQDRESVDLYRPRLANRKQAADFRLETNVTRREEG